MDVGFLDRRQSDSDPHYGWVIVATLGVTETVSYGVLFYAFAVLLVPMQLDEGWSRATLTGAYSLAILVYGIASIIVGRELDRRSPRLLMTLGSMLAALLVLAWSQASSLLELYLVFLALGVAMALVLYEPAFVVITKWFGIRRNAALTTMTLIAALASFVFSPLTQRLVSAYGWRTAVAVLALILAAITIPLHALVLRPAPHDEQQPVLTATAPTRRTVMGRLSFWLIVAAFVLSSFTTVAIAVHLVPLLIGGGATPAFAAFAAGTMGLAQIPGRLIFAFTERRFDRAAASAGVFALGAAALGLLALDQATWVVLVFALSFGMSNGMVTLLRATIIGDLYGRASYGAIAGLVSAFALAARASAPFGATLITLAPGGYTTLLGVLAAMAAIAALAVRRGTVQATEPLPAAPGLVSSSHPTR